MTSASAARRRVPVRVLRFITLTLLFIAAVFVQLHFGVSAKQASNKTASQVLLTSNTAVTIQAAGRGKPYFNFTDGRQTRVDYRGEPELTAALQSGQALPRALTAVDLDNNATPDLVAGYEYNGIGILTIQRGNPDAFAPLDRTVYERMAEGYNPEALLPTVETIQAPVPVDFLEVGDFNNDNRKDLLIGSRLGGLFLIAGDVNSGWLPAQPIALTGNLTALAAGEFRAADGKKDLAVGVSGPAGAQVLIYDGANGGLSESPMQFPLSSAANVIRFGGMDEDPFGDIVVASSNEIVVVHGWGRKQTSELVSQVERIASGSDLRGLSLGHFLWDRKGQLEIAALFGDGTLEFFGQKGLDSRGFTGDELFTRNRGQLLPEITQAARETDVEAIPGWKPAGQAGWDKLRSVATSAPASDVIPQSLLTTTNMYSRETEEVVIAASESELKMVRQVDADNLAASSALTISGDIAQLSLESAAAPVALLQLPTTISGERNMAVMQEGTAALTLVPLVATSVTVDRTDDPVVTTAGSGAAACTAALNDCSLRGAVLFSNVLANSPTTINLPANTYTLSINGTTANGCGNPENGDLGINRSTNIVGLGGGAVIVQTGTGLANDGDRVMCLNETFLVGLSDSFSNITIVGGRDGGSAGGGTALGGAGIIGGEKDNVLNLTNVTLANNQETVTGSANLGGGGIQITGGDLNITNCTIGGTVAPVAYTNRTSVTAANSQAGSGGGVTFTPSAPINPGSVGADLTVTGTTFSRNTAAGIAGGAADVLIFAFPANQGGIGSGVGNISTSTFSNNQITGTGDGGGLGVESLPTTVASTSFTNNSSGDVGGAISVGGLSLTLDGTNPSITFTGNTAPNGGTSISTASTVTVLGTNMTIGGSILVGGTNGLWNNSAGSVFAPTDVVIQGGTFNTSSATVNISGNLTISPSGNGIVGSTFNGNTGAVNIAGNFSYTGGGTSPVSSFNAGSGTFNFNGSGSQSITNSPSITFNNLTDSNVTQPLTLNNNFAVNGTLNINGANAVFAPLAATVIGGTGTLTGTGTARVTRTAATADFLSQYTITNKTLTNLLIDYVGAGAQVLSSTTYGPLRINNGNGVSSAAGTATVNGQLTLQAGALSVGTSTLVINAGTTVAGGSLTSAATGLVNYNQSSAGQAVIATNYGNLTFSAFTKVLPSSGTVGIAGTFNVNGVTTGHTITGSTIDFNGTGAQTVPTFNYNNLTISGARTTNSVTLINGGTIGIAGTFAPTATFTTGNYIVTNNTVDFNGAGAQTIPAFNYNNLTISGNRAVAITLGNGNVGIAGVFNPSVTGNTWTANPTNVVIFNGAALQTIPAFAFFNGLTLNNAAGANLGGNVTVLNSLTLTSGALGVGTNTLTLNGAASAPGGSLTSAATGTVNYNQQSNGQATVLATNYGNLTFSNFNKTLASTGTIGIAGTFTPGTATGHTITGSTINFNGAGAQTIPGFTYNNLTSTGAVARTLDPVNTIKIAGVFTPGASSYTITGSTIEYNGSAAQTLPVTFLQYNNVTFNNPTSVTGGPATMDVNGNLQITQGTFAAGGALSITVGGNWTNNGGTFSPSTGDVTFDGGAGQTIGGTAATTFNNLSVGNASGLAMNNDNTVNANLALVGSNITVAATKTLTQPAAGTSSGTFDVIGSVRHVTFTVGACPAGPCANTETFGNPNNQITVTLGTAPTDITVNLVKSAPAGFASAVQRTYTITPTGGSGIKATLRLHYLDSELNGNVEAQLNLRRFNGTGWAPYPASAADPTTNNWVENNAVLNFSPWTFSSLAPTAAPGVISGRITDNNGSPVAGAVVRLSGTQNRKFITDADGVYRFENVEASGFYTVTPTRANYTFSPAERSFTQNAQSTEAAFGAVATNSALVNPLDTAEYFVRQQYLDFLGREPDESGFNFWSDQILACGADAACVDHKRQNVSAAYFFSIEFQGTGGLVDSLNRASFGAAPQYATFAPDAKAIGAGLVVGKENWQETLEANKQAFVANFVNRDAFRAAYDAMTNADYVDTLISHTGVTFTTTERDALVNGLVQNTMTRAGVLRSIAENNRFVSAKQNEMFVMMEYFGYLRRQPDAAGFAYWLDKLNQFNGNFEQAEMVRAFIVSDEYRDRVLK